MLRRLNLLLVLLVSFGCSDSRASNSPLLVATTGHIHDALTELSKGTTLTTKVLCGPGLDPHSYRASTGDVRLMSDAAMIVRNGFHLEAKLDKLLTGDGKFAGKTWAMADAFPKEFRLDWSEDGKPNPDAPFDPHIWNHLRGWAECIEGLTAQLALRFPEDAETIQGNGKRYAAEILSQHAWATTALRVIPSERRFLVSGHDAFQYFAREYKLDTVAVLGIGNDPEPDIGSIRKVSDWICERKVPVIFLESITNPKIAEALQEACKARSWSVKIATQRLFSDDLGSKPPHNTYLGAFRSNVETILGALQPQPR